MRAPDRVTFRVPGVSTTSASPATTPVLISAEQSGASVPVDVCGRAGYLIGVKAVEWMIFDHPLKVVFLHPGGLRLENAQDEEAKKMMDFVSTCSPMVFRTVAFSTRSRFHLIA